MYIQLNPLHKDFEPIKATVHPIRDRDALIKRLTECIKDLKLGVAKLHYFNRKSAILVKSLI